ncbi:MAG: glycosyltransferase [Vicinamibacteria bacterium]|nr:glycosyltransferase [Vicinamibacteria bacterium]
MTDTPAIAVIVPTYGRPGAAARLVRALQAQHLPEGEWFEVIVVDDGSPVTVEIAAGDASTAVQVLRQARQGPAAARNAGLEAARGDLVAFIDDDCEPAPGWLAALCDAARCHPGCGLGGTVVNRLRHNPFAETSQLIVAFLCDYYQGVSTGRFFTSNNLAFPRQALQARGGFDTTYTRAAAEDRELCDRWAELGCRLVAVPDAVVLHAHPLTFGGFWRQHFEYGRGAWGYRRARAARAGAPVRIEPWRFYRDLLWYPVRAHGWRGVSLAGLVVLAQTANALGFLVEATRARLA